MSTRADEYRTAVLTTANQLTMLRIVFVPVFIILLVYRHIGWAFSIFIAAGVTDVLDGVIAREAGAPTAVATPVPKASTKNGQVAVAPLRVTSSSPSITVASSSVASPSSVRRG